MNLHDINTLDKTGLTRELFRCCGSEVWVNKMLSIFPVDDLVELLNDAEEKWNECSESDLLEAFSHHPKIGEVDSLKMKFSDTAVWAAGEQAAAADADENILQQLSSANKDYEDKFGFIFIVCATGKSAKEMLALLKIRLQNNREVEISVAAEEQLKITQLRLEKLLA
ncbi:MAG: 2-oxo-4-hydroxy-4-carboxy-5-ureidoimidazoline decarboxylase [Ferruginibacter sp.]